MKKTPLEMSEKFSLAITLLVVHGIISDSESDKAKARLDKWANKNGLRRKGANHDRGVSL